MSGIVIKGVGAVSPAGWRGADLIRAVGESVVLPCSTIERTGQSAGLMVRRVPGNPAQAAWVRHPRMRRASPITRFAAAAALEALGEDVALVTSGNLRLGIVYCVMAGCINYSGRFYQEVLADPATASPLVFPETVFNAPASHLASLLGTSAINYTQVGDDSAFVTGLATAAGWLQEDRVDGCLVIGAEEVDWLGVTAMRLFNRNAVLGEGAGAVYLRRAAHGITLETISDPHPYTANGSRVTAVRKVRDELESVGRAELWIGSQSVGDARLRAESQAWQGWAGRTCQPRTVLGDAFNAASAWQLILAADSLGAGAVDRAFVSVAGCNHAAVGLSVIRK